jgi:hypothetical protein
MNAAFNLLNYPIQARQRRLRWRVGSALAGLLMGMLLAGMAWHALQLERDALRAEHDRLQAHSAQRRVWAGDEQTRQEALATAQAQHELLTRVQQHQQAWVRLHKAVEQEARRGGWALERLHVEGDRLVLQGRIREAQALAASQARMSETLRIPLTWVSLVASSPDLNDRHLSEQVFVWQGTWPALSTSASRRTP